MPIAEREQFVDWLRESSLHVAEMLRVAQVHGALDVFERWARISTEGSAEEIASVVALPARAESRPRTRRRSVQLWGIAAAAAVITILALLLPGLRDQVIETQRAERREVVLVDGSVVQIDPQSTLRVVFRRDVRRVFLERGRALFHVAKDQQRPFLVQADATAVRAVGTAFGVERRDGGIVVTVAEGKVAVAPAREEPLLPTSEPQQLGKAVLLTAGHQITVQSTGSADAVRQVNSKRELAWAEGQLVFENVRIADVIVQFNRYNRVQMRITDEALARRPISATFNASDPEAFLVFLQASVPVNVIRDDEQRITIAPAG
jgi:transmembrane sensor